MENAHWSNRFTMLDRAGTPIATLSLLAQVFVVGAVITTWDQQAAAAG